MRSTSPATGLFLVAVAGAACAQTPPTAGSLLRQQQEAAPRRIDQLTGREPSPPLRPPLVQDSGVRVKLQSVRFTGLAGIATEAELAPLVQDAIGKELSAAQLLQLADQVTEYLKSKGWFLARAYLPVQDITAGQLEIAIVAGRLDVGMDGIVVAGDPPRLSATRIRKTLGLALLEGGEGPLHAGELERGLLLLGEMPGVSAKSILERGRQSDSTRLTVEVTEGGLLTGSNVVADNYGSRYTGTDRVTAQARLNDPSGQGDSAGLGVSKSSGLTQLSATYGIPIGYRGLSLATNAGLLHYSLGKELAPLDLTGRALTAGASLLYPFVLGPRGNLRASAAYDLKALRDDDHGTSLHDKQLTTLTLAASGDRIDEVLAGGADSYGAALVFGHADLSRVPADVASDALGPHVAGNYTKWTWTASRLQRIDGPYSVFASASGQGARNNLDASEKFILGGNTGVRAYAGGEAAGDAGWLARVEARYDKPLSDTLGVLQALVFLDAGHITLNKQVWGPAAVTTATGRNDYSLAGWGVGVNLAATGTYAVQLAWARAIGTNPGRSAAGFDSEGRSGRQRVLLQAAVYF